ncbi:MAG: class I SAM-dependent methyltransferase [Thermoplasmata archaeon]|nr:class I SAM-dependent methyltransferase [Thermoplasmata archaeon]MBE3139215.1 class I SAM-dependent methyltransferase [Thermoplasmata archaeon]
MKTRNEFGQLLNLMGLVETAVEVGVLAAEFSKVIYSVCRFKKFYLIDPWKVFGKHNIATQREIDECDVMYQKAFDDVKIWADKNKGIEVIRGISPDEAGRFENETIDFVYIDASHLYEDVKADILAWWPKVRKGGILAGHDYYKKPNFTDIKRAVDKFIERENKTLYLTTDDDPYYSWWTVK